MFSDMCMVPTTLIPVIELHSMSGDSGSAACIILTTMQAYLHRKELMIKTTKLNNVHVMVQYKQPPCTPTKQKN